MDEAACKGKPSSWFFPSKGKSTKKAKQLCAECPVRDECAEYSVRTGSVGLWAGESRRLGTETSADVTGEATTAIETTGPLDNVFELRQRDAS